MAIGTFGPITFEVSTTKNRTFDDFKRKTQSKFEQHELIGLKPKLEFVAPGLDEISFQVIFSAFLGLNPLNEATQLRDIVQKGEYHPLVIGGKTIGNFVIDNISEAWKHIDNQGNVFYIAVDVSMKEYDLAGSAGTQTTTVTAATEVANVEKITTAIQPTATAVGISAANTKQLAKTAQSATKDRVTAAEAAKKILSTVKTLQSADKNKDIPSALSSTGVKSESYTMIGLNPIALATKAKTNPTGAMKDILSGIKNSDNTKKTEATKGIVGNAAAGSVIQLAEKSADLKDLDKAVVNV